MQETDVNHYLFDHLSINTMPNVAQPLDYSLKFSDVLLLKDQKNATAKKISKKYKKLRQKKNMAKELTEEAIDNMKKSKHLRRDDMETIKCNSDVEADDGSTVNYNSDVEIDDTSGPETIDYTLINQ